MSDDHGGHKRKRYMIRKGTEVIRPYKPNPGTGKRLSGGAWFTTQLTVVYGEEDVLESDAMHLGERGYYKFKVPDNDFPYFYVHKDYVSTRYEIRDELCKCGCGLYGPHH
jgi:hypothetical protein